jgi:hypothetical protein
MTNPTPVWGPEYTVDDQSWLGSKFGTDATDTVTLDPSLFDAATHYPNGFIPSGLPLVKQGSGRYGPAAADATECDGHLFRSYTPIQPGQTAAQPWDRVAILTVGKVVASKIPVVPTARAPHVIYV